MSSFLGIYWQYGYEHDCFSRTYPTYQGSIYPLPATGLARSHYYEGGTLWLYSRYKKCSLF